MRNPFKDEIENNNGDNNPDYSPDIVGDIRDFVQGVSIATHSLSPAETKDVITDVKMSLGAVAPTPIRAKKAEATLKGKKQDDSLLETCAEAALQESSPIDDVRSSADYRKKLIKVLVKRALEQVV